MNESIPKNSEGTMTCPICGDELRKPRSDSPYVCCLNDMNHTKLIPISEGRYVKYESDNEYQKRKWIEHLPEAKKLGTIVLEGIRGSVYSVDGKPFWERQNVKPAWPTGVVCKDDIVARIFRGKSYQARFFYPADLTNVQKKRFGLSCEDGAVQKEAAQTA